MRLLLLVLSLAGCVRLEWSRQNIDEPVSAAAVRALRAGADLAVALERLGAPLRVWETADGIALAYGHVHSRDLGLAVSVTIAEFVPLSFDWDDSRLRWKGAVLWFDRSLKLIRAKTGWLSEIAPRRRPAFEGT